MNLELTAKLKTADDFFKLYQEGDEKKDFNGLSLLYYSLANNNPEARYEISSFLLNKGASVAGTDSEGYNLLQVLLSRQRHNLAETAELFERLIDLGVDVNHQDHFKQTVVYYLARMKNTDEELTIIYDKLFSLPNLKLDTADKAGNTALDFVKKLPYRQDLIKRIENYEQN